ncbi:MAG: hypothetical protein ACOZF0_18890 [Thermodesulfobacteriota bacterium]
MLSSIRQRQESNSHHVSVLQTEYHSVEIALDDFALLYQFRLRKTESCPMCFIVRKDSQLLQQLEVGRVFQMKFHASGAPGSTPYMNTRIETISIDSSGCFKDHCIVGLAVVESPPPVSMH